MDFRSKLAYRLLSSFVVLCIGAYAAYATVIFFCEILLKIIK